MNINQTFRNVRLLAVACALSTAALSSLYIYSRAIQPIPEPGPVEEFLETGFELRNLQIAEQVNALGKGEYDSESRRILAAAQQAVNDDRFPRNTAQLKAYHTRRQKNTTWSPVFHFVLYLASGGTIAAVFWLLGFTAQPPNDRQEALSSDLAARDSVSARDK